MKLKILSIIGIITCLLLPTIPSMIVQQDSEYIDDSTILPLGSQYKGFLRIYITEIDSR